MAQQRQSLRIAAEGPEILAQPMKSRHQIHQSVIALRAPFRPGFQKAWFQCARIRQATLIYSRLSGSPANYIAAPAVFPDADLSHESVAQDMAHLSYTSPVLSLTRGLKEKKKKRRRRKKKIPATPGRLPGQFSTTRLSSHFPL